MKPPCVVIRADCFEWTLAKIRPASIPLIVTDPPYGRITTEAWDQTWAVQDQWKLTALIERVLMPGGTAYVWGGIGRPGDRIFFEWLRGVGFDGRCRDEARATVHLGGEVGVCHARLSANSSSLAQG